MCFGKSIVIIFLCAILASVFNVGSVTAADADAGISHIQQAKEIVFDENRSLLFILNQDDTVSAYDIVNRQFILSRKLLSGIKNVNAPLYSFIISPDGGWMAFASATVQPRELEKSFVTKISVFRTEDVLTDLSPLPTVVYTFPSPQEGRIFGRFSADSKTLLVSGSKEIFLLGMDTFRQESVAVQGGAPARMELDAYGRALILKAGSNTLDIIGLAEKKALVTITLAAQPRNLLFNSATGKVFIAHGGGNGISVVDIQTMAVIKNISIEDGLMEMTYDKHTGEVFIVNSSTGTLSVVTPDLQVKTMAVQSPAYTNARRFSTTLSYLNGQKKLFIMNVTTGKLFVYDAISGAVIKEEKMEALPEKLLGSEKLGVVFVKYASADIIGQIDGMTLETMRIPDTASVTDPLSFSSPYGIAADSQKNRIFVANQGSNTLTVIDGKEQKPIAEIAVRPFPQIASFQPQTKKLYSYNLGDTVIAVVDVTRNDYPVKMVDIGVEPYGIAFDMKTGRVYVSSASAGKVIVLDGTSDTILATMQLPQGTTPTMLLVDEKRNKIYAAAANGDDLFVINGATNALDKKITVGKSPTQAFLLPKLNRVVVTVAEDKKIIVIDPTSEEVVQTLDVGTFGQPYRLFVDPRTDYVYVNFRNTDRMLVLTRNRSSDSFRILKDVTVPFFGQMNAKPYVTFAVNETTGLAYFTSGDVNSVDIVNPALGVDGVINPRWYATVYNGKTSFSSEAQQRMQSDRQESKSSFFSWFGSARILITALLGILVAYWMVWYVKKKA